MQILHGLDALHSADIIHRGLSIRCVGLTTSDRQGDNKRVKIFDTAYRARLFDMNRSEPFCENPGVKTEFTLPEGWYVYPPCRISPWESFLLYRMSKDVLESPLEYTKARDIHDVGVILMQMLLGKDVSENYPDFQTALSTGK